MDSNEEPETQQISAQTSQNSYKKAELKATSILWICGLLCSLFAFGLYDFLLENEPNKCGMSYMYEVPQYIPLKNPKHSKYGLYAYGEGPLSEGLKKGQFTGNCHFPEKLFFSDSKNLCFKNSSNTICVEMLHIVCGKCLIRTFVQSVVL